MGRMNASWKMNNARWSRTGCPIRCDFPTLRIYMGVHMTKHDSSGIDFKQYKQVKRPSSSHPCFGISFSQRYDECNPDNSACSKLFLTFTCFTFAINNFCQCRWSLPLILFLHIPREAS